MIMALACSGALPSVLVPGGVTLLPENGEDAGKVQTIGARFVQEQITLEYAAEMAATPARLRAVAASFRHSGDRAGGQRGAGIEPARTRLWGQAASPSSWTPQHARRERWCA